MRISLQKTIGNNLRLLRSTKNISQKDMAETVGLTRSLYAQYELGNRTPDAESLYTIALCFGIDMSLMFESDPNKFLNELSNTGNYNIIGKELMETFSKLSEFSQGRLLEYAHKLFEWDSLKQYNSVSLEYRKSSTKNTSL